MKSTFPKLLSGALCLAMGLSGAASASSVSMLTSVDDAMSFYISTDDSSPGLLIDTNTFGTYKTIVGTLTPGVTNFLHVQAFNTIGGGAWVAELTLSDGAFAFADGGRFLQTKPSTVLASNTGFGQDYFTPYSHGTLAAWGITDPYLQPSTLEGIWGSTGYDPTVYFSIAVNPVPEPETYALLLAGLGLVGLAVRRRMQL